MISGFMVNKHLIKDKLLKTNENAEDVIDRGTATRTGTGTY